MNDEPSVLLAGVGGVGGVIAGELLLHRRNVALVTHNADITAAVRANGLAVTTPERSFRVGAPRVFTALEEAAVEAPFDIALLAMKATGVLAAADGVLPLLRSPDGYVVTLQNGIVEDAVAGLVGPSRVISGIVGWGATMHRPGIYERTSGGATHIGELDGTGSRRVRRLGELLDCATRVDVNLNIRGALWSKLAINCCITTLGALSGQTLGDMLARSLGRRAFLHIYREVVDTAHAAGVRLESIATDPMRLYVPADASAPGRLWKSALVRLVGLRYRRLKSSSLQSLERGRATEIDFLNGHVVAEASKHGVAVPFNRAAVTLVKEIEAGTRPIHADNLAALVQLATARQ